jgi:hypothetical protein
MYWNARLNTAGKQCGYWNAGPLRLPRAQEINNDGVSNGGNNDSI